MIRGWLQGGRTVRRPSGMSMKKLLWFPARGTVNLRSSPDDIYIIKENCVETMAPF